MRELRRSRGAAVDLAVAGVLALLVLLPIWLGRGYLLVGDMVFVPDQPWKDAWLGLDGGVPRAVPSDAITSVITRALPGDLVQKLLLTGTLVLAGVGTGRWLARCSGPARAAAIVLVVWNPYVYARLAIGHWALLIGYAALPWVALAAARIRARSGGGWPALVVTLGVAAFASPTGGLLAALVAVALLAGQWLDAARAAGFALLLNAPWLLPGVLIGSGGQAPDDFGVAAFAARADTPWGSVGSLLTFGGMWKSAVDAPGRDSWLLSGIALGLTLAGLAGLVLVRRADASTRRALLGLAAVALVLAALPTVAVGRDLVEWLVREVPGAGLLRDSQKWVAPLVLAVAWGIAHGLDALRSRWPVAGTPAAAAALVLPVAVLPGLGWGLLGMLEPAPYPQEWAQVRTLLDDEGAAEQRTVVLPFQVYRRFDWNDRLAVLDPAGRYFPGDVITDDTLTVDGGAVRGETALADRIRDAASPEELTTVLADAGVAWALVHKDGSTGVPAGELVHDGPELQLVRLDGDAAPRRTGSASAILAVDALALAAWLAAAGILGGRRIDAYTSLREKRESGGT